MRVFLTGADGLLGTAFFAAARTDPAAAGWQVDGVSRDDFDLTDRVALDAAVDRFRPDAVIHAAAHAIVDDCERDPRLALRVNVEGTRNVVASCPSSRLIYISSDYVFDGVEPPAAGYAEGDLPAPRNVYGLTKLAGEHVVERHPDPVVVRTSWLFGGPDEKVDQVLALLRSSLRGEAAPLIADQFSRPTYTLDLARALIQVIARPEIGGTIHVANEGRASWYDVGLHLAKTAPPDRPAPHPEPISLAQAGFVGERPRDSTLSTARLEALGLALPPWPDAVDRFRTAVLDTE